MIRLGRAGAAGALLLPPLTEFRLKRAAQPLTGRWQRLPVEPRGRTLLGISFRPLQVEALGLDPQATLQALLAYPFQLVRLGAYWSRMEPGPGSFDPTELDLQVDAAERAGKQIILGVGRAEDLRLPGVLRAAHHLSRPCPSTACPASRPHDAAVGGDRFLDGSLSATADRRGSWPGRSSTRRSIRWAWSTRGGWTRTSSPPRWRLCARRTRPARS